MLLTGGGQADQALANSEDEGSRMAQTPQAYARHHDGGQPPYLYPDYASTVKRAPAHPFRAHAVGNHRAELRERLGRTGGHRPHQAA